MNFSLFSSRWLQKALPKHPQDSPRPSLGPPRQPRHILRHENSAPLRVRETPPRNGVGRKLPRRQNQRNLPATHLVSAVSSLPALLPPQHGSLQGKVSRWFRECLEASLAFNADYVNKFKMPRGIISRRILGKRIKMISEI
jgi:hypothetical protein